jgi:DNA-binding NarL/FixJ family response regulator
MKTIRILLVDDHFVVRVGLAYSLELEPDFKVVAEAGTGSVVQDLYRKHRPDVVIMDWKLPNENGD